jgi:hypothetical protein
MSDNGHSNDILAVVKKPRSWLTGKWSPMCLIIESTPGARWLDICRPDSPGVYRLIALKANVPGIIPASLDRVCGVDPTGTLYIGHSRSSLRSRLASIVKANATDDRLNVGSGGHRTMAAKLGRRFPPRWRAISWQQLDSANAAVNREGALLRAYKTRYGELPPMNEQSGI